MPADTMAGRRALPGLRSIRTFHDVSPLRKRNSDCTLAQGA